LFHCSKWPSHQHEKITKQCRPVAPNHSPLECLQQQIQQPCFLHALSVLCYPPVTSKRLDYVTVSASTIHIQSPIIVALHVCEATVSVILYASLCDFLLIIRSDDRRLFSKKAMLTSPFSIILQYTCFYEKC